MSAPVVRILSRSPINLAHVGDFDLGAMRVRPQARELEVGERTERLEPRVMQALVALHDAAGEVVSRDDLIARCWDGVVVGDDAINRVMLKLRRLSRIDGGRSFTLGTVPRVGYRLTAAPPPDQRPSEAPMPSLIALARRRWRLLGARARLAAIGAVLLAVGTLGAALWLQPPRDVRIAVFTLQTPAGDAALDTLARVVTTEVVDTLTQIGIETASSSEAADSQLRSIAQRARSLGATLTLDGELIREGETVRASVRLSDVNGRRTLWAQTFERQSEQAPELRLQLASVAVAVTQCAVEARRETPELTASSLSLFLRSCELFLDLNLNPRIQEEALRLTEQAAQLAPGSSLVQGRLAGIAYEASLSAHPRRRERLTEQAAAAADAALRINPRNGDALFVKIDLLSLTVSRGEWETALVAALDQAPDSGELNSYFAYFLRTHGRPAEAVPYLRRALARNPLSPGRVSALAFTLATVGGDREAFEFLTHAAARWPGNRDVMWERFRMNLWFGSRTEALRLLEEEEASTTSVSGRREIQCLRRIVTGLGASTDAAKRQVARDVHECWQPYDRFVVLASIGDVDAAFADVERMLAACPGATTVSGASAALPVSCSLDFPWRTLFYPMTASMRSDPRFMPLMRHGGLAAYWLESDRWPEFCDDPGLPYDCRQAALRVSGRMQHQ